MKATLNIRFDKETIEAAKRYADKHFVSDDLVGIIAEYKEFLDEELRERYLKGKHNA